MCDTLLKKLQNKINHHEFIVSNSMIIIINSSFTLFQYLQ